MTMAEENRCSLQAIAGRLEAARHALGFSTKKAFADAIGGGMTPQKWNNYLKCRDRIPVDIAIRLCARFGLSLDWIYLGTTRNLPGELARKIRALEASSGLGRHSKMSE